MDFKIDGNPVALIYNRLGSDFLCYTIRYADGSERQVREPEREFWDIHHALNAVLEHTTSRYTS